MKVLIHAGIHKTGSSSIQESLRNLGRTSGNRYGVATSSFELDSLLATPVEHQPEIAIYSDESAFGEFYGFYADSSTRMKTLRERLHSHEIISVVFFIRDYVSWLESCFVQFVHEGNAGNPNNFASELLGVRPNLYSSLFEDAQKIFGERVVEIRYLAPKEDAIGQLSACWRSAAGLPKLLPVLGGRQNTSNPNKASIWTLSQLNAFDGAENLGLRSYLQNLSTGRISNSCFFSLETQRALLQMQALDGARFESMVKPSSVFSAREFLEAGLHSELRTPMNWVDGIEGFEEVFLAVSEKSRRQFKRIQAVKSALSPLLRVMQVFKRPKKVRK